MKQLLLVTSILLFAQSLFSQTGREIMEEQQRRHEVPLEFSQSTMTLIDSRGRERPRKMINYSKKPENDNNKSLIKFLEPTNIYNVGLLTWEQEASEEDDQWLYLPASKDIKRITGGSKANSFMGSDFAFEDMRGETLDTHNYTVIREETIDGQSCWVVESLPSTEKEKKDSGYSKRIFWVRKDIYFTIQAEFYDRRGNLSKTGQYEDLVVVSGETYRCNKITMKTIKRKTQTILTTNKRDVESEVSDSMFDTQSLKRPPLIK